jgi:CRISPR-associated protein Cas1
MQDLHILPKLRDSLTYLYIEHAIIEKQDNALLVLQETGRTAVPIANLSLLMLGPGTSLTHAAMKILAENGCSVLWTGEDIQRFYAQGLGETRRAYHLLRQAELATNSTSRLQIVYRMYEKRFCRRLPSDIDIETIRGMEGVRMRTAYQDASRIFGVRWGGRKYDRSNWTNSDPINRSLSAANALLNGLCHAAIVSGGYSPALGFLHTGKQLSFVYDIADLYKVEFTIPAAFETIASGIDDIEKRTRENCRERFRIEKLLQRILPDIDDLLGIKDMEEFQADSDPAVPEAWWSPTEEEDELISESEG